LKENPEVLKRIDKEVKLKLGIPVREPDAKAATAADKK
jgi:hypothetical protein